MILNSNIIFWTPILEYLKILSLPNQKLSLSQLVTARRKTNTNLRRNVCEPQLQNIPNNTLTFFSLSAVRSVKTDLTLNVVSKIYVHHGSCTLRPVDFIVYCCSHCVWEFCVCSLFCYTVLSINSSFALIPLGKRERADCFILIVILLSCDCECSVSLPHGVVDWSAENDCGIFWTLSLKNCAQHRRLPDFIPHISWTD